MNQPLQPPAAPVRRRRWWRGCLWSLAILLLLAGAGVGVVWWALTSGWVGDQVSDYWSNGRKMPGYAHVGRIEVQGTDRVVVHDVSVHRERGGPPVFTANRITASGELWRKQVTQVRIEGARLDLTADNVRFIHAVVRRETEIPTDGPPLRRRIIIDGAATLEGVPLANGVTAELEQFGPAVSGIGNIADIDGRPFLLEIKAEGQGEDLHHRFRVLPGTGLVSAHRITARLAKLDLLPPIPAEAMPWVPDLVDPIGSEVLGDRHWDLFTGEGRLTWAEGRIAAGLTIDRRHLRLDRLAIAAERTVGSLEGTLTVDFPANAVEVNANRWRPGPGAPLPAIIPVDAILAVMPQAVFKAQRGKDWTLGLQLAGGNAAQAELAWTPGRPLAIEGVRIPVSLLQAFLPGGLDLAAGRAMRLRVVVGDRLEELHVEIEQARALWNGWALGTVEAVVDAKPVDQGYGLIVDLMNLQAESRRSLGRITWSGSATAGEAGVRVDDLQALLARIKGPITLPDLRGGVDAEMQIGLAADGVRGRLRNLKIKGGVFALVDRATDGTATMHEELRGVDARAQGPFAIVKGVLDARIDGRIDRGQFNLAENWIDLALRNPIYSCRIQTADGQVEIQRLLLRATDARGQPVADGFSASMDVTVTTSPLAATAIGVVDHADLGWMASLMPQTVNRLRGEGAVTFQANLQSSGIRVEGWLLPLGATLDLGGSFRATGLTGAVQFLIARKAQLPTSAAR